LPFGLPGLDQYLTTISPAAYATAILKKKSNSSKTVCALEGFILFVGLQEP
jgi:hypothetical protein